MGVGGADEAVDVGDEGVAAEEVEYPDAEGPRHTRQDDFLAIRWRGGAVGCGLVIEIWF